MSSKKLTEHDQPDPAAEAPGERPDGATLSRRTFIGSAGLVGGGLLVGGLGTKLLSGGSSEQSLGSGTGSVPFHGTHQAGILTPQQDRLHFAAFDVTTTSTRELRALLEAWSSAAAAMTAGEEIGPRSENATVPPADSGEALGLAPSRLTVTIGFGPGLFGVGGRDRLGLRSKFPPLLEPLPALPGDKLKPEISDGEICVQACSDDPQAAFHAVRNLTRLGRGVVRLRWSQQGFGRTSSTSDAQQTPRNLFGFKDGTNNITAEEGPEVFERHLWAQADDGPAWMAGGSYMVTRRIQMLTDRWDRASLDQQERTFGRRKVSGAPLTGTHERDFPDYHETDAKGQRVIPKSAHMRLAAPENSGGIRMLRRGYSFADGSEADGSQLDAGLFFIAFQRDPHMQFVPIQTRLGRNDALNEYIVHRSSALFAVAPGVPDAPGRFVGDGLFS